MPFLSFRNMEGTSAQHGTNNNARGRGPDDDARGRGPDDDARGRGPDDDARGRGPDDDARGRGPDDDARGGGLDDDTRGRGQDDDTRGLGSRRERVTRRTMRRSRNRTLSPAEGAYEERVTMRRSGSGTDRRTRRKRRHSSSSSESSGESVKVHPKYKRSRITDSSTSQILDKFLSIIKDVRDSDRPKLSYENNVIPDFDPMTKEQTILTWINKVEECAEIYGWDDRAIVHYALPKLRGVAKSWYQGLPSVLFSWSEWKKKLIESFPVREDYAELLTEMLGKRVRYGESLEHYYYAKINLLNRCNITGKRAVDCLLHGLDDRAIKVGAQAAQFSEPEHVLKYFRSVHLGTVRENSDGRRNRIDKLVPNKSNHTKVGNVNLAIRCFNCNQLGHPSFRCDKPLIKCANCGRIGHQTSDCPRGKTYSQSDNRPDKNEKQVSELSLADRKNDKYIMSIRVNDIPFQCHLDLGSQCTLMREKDAKVLGLNLHTDVDLPMLRGIGANVVKPLGLIHTTVEVQNIKENVDIYVVEDYVLGHPVLLGHSFTEKPNIMITKTPDEIIFRKVQSSDKVHLVSRHAQRIPVNALRAVSVHCESLNEGTIIVAGSIRGPQGKEYYLLPGEYSVTNNTCAVLIQNVSGSDIIVEHDSLITRATKVQTTVNACAVTISTTNVDDTIVCNPNFTSEERLNLQTLLSEYKECFSSGLDDLGFTNATEMTIDLDDDEPVVYRPYRLSHAERSQVQNMVQEMIDNNIVRESSSPYASPIVLVKKKTGEKRLCVDYRALNRKTKKDHYPLPRIEDQLDLLSGNKLFTSLDLASGYYQIPIDEKSRLKTAFVTPDGQFEYNRMPFGLVNAPAVFQRTMNKILAEAKIKYALVYMDDILIPSKDLDEGMTRLREVLDLLKNGRLTLKMSKCNFFLDKIDFLGFEVSANGIRPGNRKTDAVSRFPPPRNQHELRQFLGLSGFFRRFIKDYALIAAPLTELLKKDREWDWGRIQDESFLAIKKMLSERPVLALYNPLAETQLHTDASKHGLAGILLQRNNNDVFQPVSYFSRKTTPEEQKYHSFELETLAIIASLSRFRVYLIGISFTILTDCNAIRSTFTKRDLVPRVARWWIQFQEYDCSIEYRPGARMPHVDALSRNPVETPQAENHTLDVLVVESEQDWITTVQSSDEEIVRIKDILSNPETENVAEIYKNFKLKNGRVYRIIGDEIRWVVPKGSRWQILKRNHDDVGHYGYEKTLERVKKHFWFSRMRRFVKKYVSACLECAHHKAPGGRREGELHPIEKPSVPFHTIHVDHLGPFVRSRLGNCYLLVIVDGFTKFVNITAVKNTRSLTTIKVLKDHFSYFGVPTRLITDRGTSFTSKTFKEFTTENGVKHVLNAVATPRANGQVERFNRTITEALATSNHGKDEKAWDENVCDIQIGLNTTVHKTTQKSPSELLFGFNVNHRAQGILSTVINETINLTPTDELGTVREEASERIETQQLKDAERFNKHRKCSRKYIVGDLVRISRQVPHDGQSQKLVVKYQGPYRVLKVLEHDRYVVEDTPLSRKGGRRYEGIVAVDKIQPWMSFDRNFDNSTDDDDDEINNSDNRSDNSSNENNVRNDSVDNAINI
ncbi:uncharacterized protein LOC123722212 [Papilio machaon]|uniref:uncharacterized protein LOC123722212 n=1 Tax=Papilio machaon TaxID=76193 RepID=UPI001E662F24|nr:uncharacterized protein LOC123722212 [Papilio machaon]